MPISLIPILISVILLLIVFIFIFYKLGLSQGKSQKELEWQKNLVSLRSQIADRQRAGIKGKVTEAFAPFLEGFPFKASESKFIGDPIDYLVFEGLDERDIKGVHLVEVKENTSKLSKHQKQIKDLIDNLDSDEVTFSTFNFKKD
jgi:predicted Holliday junction resolvase-like endonuclease